MWLREDVEAAISLAGVGALPALKGRPKRDTAAEDLVQLLYVNEHGRKMGRSFSDAACRMAIKCRVDPDKPNNILVQLCPQVEYGKRRMRYVRNGNKITARRARRHFSFSFLSTEVSSPPKHILVLGGRQTSPLSLGGFCFFDRQATQTWARTIVIVPERITGELKGGKTPMARPKPR